MKTRGKIVSMYIVTVVILIAIINVVIYFQFQSLIAHKVISMDAQMALQLMDAKYEGSWQLKDGELYKGEIKVRENNELVDYVKQMAHADSTIFLGDERIATTVEKNGERQIGTKAAAVVVQEVLKQGHDYIGTADVVGTPYITSYLPIKDDSGNVIGMFFVGIPQEVVNKDVNAVIWKIIIISLISLVIGIGLYHLLISMRIMKPLTAAKNYIHTMATGNFTTEFPNELLTSNDEFGEMLRALNELQTKMKEAVTNIQQQSISVGNQANTLAATSEQMSSSTEEVASTMQQVAEGAANQANDLTEIAHSLAYLTQKVENVYVELGKVKEETTRTADKADIGKQEMDALIAAIDEMKQAFDLVVEKVANLTQSVQQISHITEMISTISEQTNLLALNAAIEAARAGTAGKGFAVVADEVRKLAEQAKRSTEEIVQLISSIQTDASNVTNTSQQVKQFIDRQTGAVEKTVRSFGDILASISRIAPLLNRTDEAMGEIVKAKDDVIGKVEQISAVAEENSAATEEVTASTEELTASAQEIAATAQQLNAISDHLQQTVRQFTV
ncbi:methyl-accepting chemotaxis protein [Anoxybacillus voinovskiensis]|uniref:Methyl-accepting chemotaxis protein n=1 Tax=Anoxybacteroides voinovskiense TaxID=230470 RepID=A0A840DMM6_9BACL|nr:methyl-accepting chemotaxis protein [Anoxybacillus voinovskiensis]MBB4074170.1 methyl-accepting chemotaxis protein [Anoxybacillus voinovskiensis]GGJ57098.1 methyl-accepting chemotaxis protein TlpC [Anoxybacillus voinovskiensis]